MMKLSTKILIGFFGFVFLYLTAAFAEIRFAGTPNVIDNKNSIAETVDLSGGIRYIILNDFEREVKVIGSDRAELEVRSFSGNVLKSLKYKITGDTLMLSGLTSEDSRAVRITLFVPKSGLTGISINSSFVSIEGLQQEHLRISENDARVWMADNAIGKFETDLSKKSFLEINTSELDTVAVTIEASQLFISTPVGLLQGEMKNHSSVQLTQLREIQLKKDITSELKMY